MDAICGMLGERDIVSTKNMAAALTHRARVMRPIEGDDFVIMASTFGAAPVCAVDGQPRDRAGTPLDMDAFGAHCRSVAHPDALELAGAFAGVVQRAPDVWWLLRDRLGQRPLYYAIVKDALVFASELKALLASGLIRACMNRQAADAYFTFGCAPSPITLIEGVFRVRPGHVLTFTHRKAEQHRFAQFNTNPVDTDKNEASAHLQGIVERSVTRTVSNRVLLSAGVDSAAIAALKRKASPVFIALERGWQDEGRMTRESAKQLNLPLTVFPGRRFTEEEFATMCRALDDPVADASILPLWLVLQRASEWSPALLSGHGADELLGGFPRYRLLQRTRVAGAAIPAGMMSDLLPALPPNAFVRRGSRFLASGNNSIEAHLSLFSMFDADERRELYSPSMHESSLDQGGVATLVKPYCRGSDLTQTMLDFDLHIALPDMMLMKCERIASTHGVALELPYFDDELVDYAIRLDPKVAYGVRSKPLLRMAMKGTLPHRIRFRARRGFRVPQSGRLQRVIENVARATITQERAHDIGLFQWRSIEQILHAASHNIYRRRQFWALLLFFAWRRFVVEKS